MKKYLFTSESVTEGHPDKLCDLISLPCFDRITYWIGKFSSYTALELDKYDSNNFDSPTTCDWINMFTSSIPKSETDRYNVP